MISLRGQRCIATIVSALLGGSALLLYLPASSSSSKTFGHAILCACTPGWLLAYAITGGVHSGHMQLFPALTAVFTALLWFAAITLALSAIRKRHKAPN